jgi:hypothetical protein
VLRAVHRGRVRGDVVATATATVTRPRSLEREEQGADRARLAAIAAAGGGRLLDDAARLDPLPPRPGDAPPGEAPRSFALLVAAALLCLDLLARRLPSRDRARA